MNSTNTELPHINQTTIECDLREFTRWLNLLADQVNYLTALYQALKAQVDTNTENIRLLTIRVSNLETRMTNVENRVTVVEGDIAQIKSDLTTLTAVVQAISTKLDQLYDWLPVPYGTIPARNWKFAMGNINVMSTQTSPSDVSGPGLYTSGSVENNDITFN